MASGEQRPSRCLSIRRDHTPREIQSIVFLLLWTMWAIYLHGLCSFFWKIAYIDLTWVKTMCVIYLSTWTQFFLFLFFLKIISHWSLFHLIFLYLCLESHHPIHLVRPYGRLTLCGFSSGHPFPDLNTESALTVLVALTLGCKRLH